MDLRAFFIRNSNCPPPIYCISGAPNYRKSHGLAIMHKWGNFQKFSNQVYIRNEFYMRAQNSSVLTQERTDKTQHMFHTEGGGQVRINLEKQGRKYIVKVEVDLSHYINAVNSPPLHLHWGLSRSDSADWVLLEPQTAPPNTVFLSGKDEAMQTPMQPSSNIHTLQIELPVALAPFYVSFIIYRPPFENNKELWIRSTSGTNFCVPVGLLNGRAEPLGVSYAQAGSANFALYSKHATNVTLCLYTVDDTEPNMEIDLDPLVNKTGDIWHVEVPSYKGFVRYGYRCKGEKGWDNGNRFHTRRVLLDPYAKFVAPPVAGQEELPSPATALGWLKTDSEIFNWEDDTRPCIPLERVIAYRLDVAGFTIDPSSGLDVSLRGTFRGLIEKIPHFRYLGVNTVILQPIFSHDQTQGQYYPLSFFSIMDVYDSAKDSFSASLSFKEMVKALHKNGMEVILDVVYTHTAEKGDEAPETISFRGIDNQTYYVLDERKRVLQSESSAANIFNCNHPAVHKMILDSLRYMVEEYHVDGFCFVNAHDLLRGPHAELLTRPLLIECISFDPMLSQCELIAEDSKPIKFPHWKRWCEWNNNFHDDVNSFFNGDQGKLSNFATRFCGSGDMFTDGRGPSFSFNYIANTYGLTLADTMSSSEVDVSSETQIKQMRNLLVTLFLSQGVPVLNMGDEYGHSNDGKLGKQRHFNWNKLNTNIELCQLISHLISLRVRRNDLLQNKEFIEPTQIKWHGPQPEEEPTWNDPESSFLAVSLRSSKDGFGDLCIFFNAQEEPVDATLPELPEEMTWLRITDTSLSHPDTLIQDGAPLSSQIIYNVQPSSVVVLEATSSVN